MSEDLQEQKKALRKHIRGLKAAIPAEEKLRRSASIFANIEQQHWFQEAAVVMCYWSMPDEVDTHDFCRRWMNTKTILLPRMVGDNIIPVVFDGKLHREPVLGIEEPVGPAYGNIDMINIIIVPGIAFDDSGNRMGRGKAFYDKFLEHSTALKIGVCFVEQVAAQVPHDENDIRMNHVVYF